MPEVDADWIEFTEESLFLNSFLAHQKNYHKKFSPKSSLSYEGFDLLDLGVFTSNLVSHFGLIA